jgi:hypothetical protein
VEIVFAAARGVISVQELRSLSVGEGELAAYTSGRVKDGVTMIVLLLTILNLKLIQIKYDGDPFTRVSQTFDYSNPPYPDLEQKGGPIVAQLDYTKVGQLVTIDSWDTNWRDEWPLRLAVNYLSQCLYPTSKNFVIRVQKDEAYAFWVSERFLPSTNHPDEYLYG